MPLDLHALGVTLGVDVAVAASCLAAFTWLRSTTRHLRRFYAPRRYASEVPPVARPPRLRWWCWAWQLARLRRERLLALAGTDGAQHLNMLNLGLRLFMLLSVWGLAVVLPVNMLGSEVDNLMRDPHPNTNTSQHSPSAVNASTMATGASLLLDDGLATWGNPAAAGSAVRPPGVPGGGHPSSAEAAEGAGHPGASSSETHGSGGVASNRTSCSGNCAGEAGGYVRHWSQAAEEEGGGAEEPGSASLPGTPAAGSQYVFSDLDRLSLANISPGSRLMWVHLASVYVVTAVALMVLWRHSREAVALRLLYVTHSPPGGSSHTALIRDIPGLEYGTLRHAVRHWLADATLARLLPRRLRRALEGAVVRVAGTAQGSITAAGNLASRYLDRLDGLLSWSSGAAPHDGAGVAGAGSSRGVGVGVAGFGGPAEGGAGLPAEERTAPAPSLEPHTAAGRRTAPGQGQHAGRSGDGSDQDDDDDDDDVRSSPAGGPGPGTTVPPSPASSPPLVAPSPSPLLTPSPSPSPSASSPSPPPDGRDAGLGASHPEDGRPGGSALGGRSATSGSESTRPLLLRHRRPRRLSNSDRDEHSHPPPADAASSGMRSLQRRRRYQQQQQERDVVAAVATRGSRPANGWERAAAALRTMDLPTFITRELGEVFPPCHLVALHVVRDERSLAGIVQQYGATKRSLEDLIDFYAARLAAGRRVRRRKVRVLGPLLGQWAIDLYGLRPVRVDELLHMRTRLEVLFDQIRQGLARVGELPYVPTAFATFSRRWDAALVSTALHDRDEALWRPCPAPHPGELLWDNLRLRLWQLSWRTAVARAAFVALLLSYTVPVSALQGLVQVRRMEGVPVLRALVRVPVVRGLLSGVLPGAVLRLVLALLPQLLSPLVRWTGAASLSEVDFRTTTLAFDFQVVAVFVASFVAGALLNQISEFVAQPGAVLTVLGTGAPQTASFFIAYILFSGLVVAPLGFLRPLGLATLPLRSGLAATPRARARLWAAPQARYALSVPHHSLMILLGMVYSLVNPLVLPACVLYFGLVGLLERYQHCYCWGGSYESGGKMWSQVFRHVMAGLYTFHVVMLALLSIKRFPFAPLLLPAPLAAAAFHRALHSLYSRPWNTTSLRDAADLDEADDQQSGKGMGQQAAAASAGGDVASAGGDSGADRGAPLPTGWQLGTAGDLTPSVPLQPRSTLLYGDTAATGVGALVPHAAFGADGADTDDGGADGDGGAADDDDLEGRSIPREGPQPPSTVAMLLSGQHSGGGAGRAYAGRGGGSSSSGGGGGTDLHPQAHPQTATVTPAGDRTGPRTGGRSSGAQGAAAGGIGAPDARRQPHTSADMRPPPSASSPPPSAGMQPHPGPAPAALPAPTAPPTETGFNLGPHPPRGLAITESGEGTQAGSEAMRQPIRAVWQPPAPLAPSTQPSWTLAPAQPLPWLPPQPSQPRSAPAAAPAGPLASGVMAANAPKCDASGTAFGSEGGAAAAAAAAAAAGSSTPTVALLPGPGAGHGGVGVGRLRSFPSQALAAAVTVSSLAASHSLYLSPARQVVSEAGAAAHQQLVQEAKDMDRRLQSAEALAPPRTIRGSSRRWSWRSGHVPPAEGATGVPAREGGTG